MALKAGRVGVYPEDLDKEGHIKQNEVEPYELPIATSEVLGGVKPVAKTEGMTEDVGVDSAGKLYAPALPIATSEVLGGVKPVAKTEGMTQDVGVDANGKLYVPSASGGKIYTKTFEFNSSTGLGTGFRMTPNVDIAGYTPISLVVRDKSSGYYAVGSLYKNRDADGKTKGMMYTGSAATNFQAIVYYVKNEDIETLS